MAVARYAVFVLPLFAISALALSPDPGHGREHFQHWYPQYRKQLRAAISGVCKEEYDNYLVDPIHMLRTADDNDTIPGCESCYMQPVLSCLLDDMSEFLKSQMASTGILLGLLPTVVSQVGSSTVETGLLALHRPFLAFLLSAATPAVGTDSVRAFDSDEIIKILLSRTGNALQWPSFKAVTTSHRRQKTIAILLSIAQYLSAIGAVVNIALCTAELGRAAIFAMSPSAIYLPGLYILLALSIYIMGSIVVRFRTRLYEKFRGNSREYKPGFWLWLKHAVLPLEFFFLSEADDRKQLYLEVLPESRVLWAATWVVRSGTICVYIFGTLMFSSILFVGPLDGLKIIARYLASAVVCRMIMVYELVEISKTILKGHWSDPQRLSLGMLDKEALRKEDMIPLTQVESVQQEVA